MPPPWPFGVVVADGRVDEVGVAASPDPPTDVGDGGVPRDRRVHDEHVGLAGDGSPAIVRAIPVQRRTHHGHVAVEREDRAPGPICGVPVDGRIDHRHIAVLVGVERASVTIGRVAVHVGSHDQDVAGRADRSSGAVNEVVAEDGVVDLHSPAAGVDSSPVVPCEVAREDRPDDRHASLREDRPAGLLGQVLHHHRVHHDDLATGGDRRSRAVVAATGQGDVLHHEEPGRVLPEDALLEARLADGESVPVEHERPKRFPDRAAGLARAHEDVGGELDRCLQRVGPRFAEFSLRRDQHGGIFWTDRDFGSIPGTSPQESRGQPRGIRSQARPGGSTGLLVPAGAEAGVERRHQAHGISAGIVGSHPDAQDVGPSCDWHGLVGQPADRRGVTVRSPTAGPGAVTTRSTIEEASAPTRRRRFAPCMGVTATPSEGDGFSACNPPAFLRGQSSSTQRRIGCETRSIGHSDYSYAHRRRV